MIRSGSAAECVGLDLEIPATAKIVKAVHLSFVEETVDPLRSAPASPKGNFILPADEALGVEPEGTRAFSPESQCPERNAELCCPTGRITRDGDVPDAIPVLVGVIQPVELGVPHRAVRVGAEDETAAPIVKAVDEQHDIIVYVEVGVSSELSCVNPVNVGVIGVHSHVECLPVTRDLEDGSLGARGPLVGFALAELGNGVGRVPEGLVQAAIELHRPNNPVRTKWNRSAIDTLLA